MRHQAAILSVLTACLATLPGGSARAAALADFIDFSLPNPAGGAALVPGRLYVPPEAANGPRPFILFLHGAGESGANNVTQVNNNIDNLLAEAKRRGAYLYAPQTNSGWGNATTNARVMSMLDRALAEQNVNVNMTYVTGLSMGGGGTWNFLNHYGDRFAAAIPICAVGPSGGFAVANIIDKPIWAFHARNDGTVGVATTRNVFNALLAANGEPAPTYLTTRDLRDSIFASASLDLHYTEYYTGGHGIWPRVYNGTTNAAVYDWLFAHALPEPSGLALAAIGVLAASRRRGAPG